MIRDILLPHHVRLKYFLSGILQAHQQSFHPCPRTWLLQINAGMQRQTDSVLRQFGLHGRERQLQLHDSEIRGSFLTARSPVTRVAGEPRSGGFFGRTEKVKK